MATYLPTTETIAMVDEYTGSVNTTKKDVLKDEEIMIPYSRVLFISWDKEAGKRLQEIRNAKGLSQGGLAKLVKTDVSLDTIISLEQAKVKSVSREKLDILLNTLDCDVRSLFPSVTVKNF